MMSAEVCHFVEAARICMTPVSVGRLLFIIDAAQECPRTLKQLASPCPHA